MAKMISHRSQNVLRTRSRIGSQVAGLALFAAVLAQAPCASAENFASLGEGFDLDPRYPTPAGDRFTLVPETRIRDENCSDRPCWFALSTLFSYAVAPLTLKS